jgi:pimeloyl-ACP methyl ester carboxylesterase
MDFDVHRYRSACGTLDLAARIWESSGPPLLLMHGLTRNGADFEPLARHLAGKYRLIAPDQRGRGLSERDPDPANYRPDVYTADMFALLDDLGLSQVTAIGTSMGGLMVFLMNSIRPGVLDAVVLNDVGPELDPAGLARIGGYVGPSGPMASWAEAAERCRAINGEALPYLDDADWLAFARRTCAEKADGTIDFDYDPAIAQGFADADPDAQPTDLWPLWDALDTGPVLVVRGANSDLLSRDTFLTMAERHSGPYAAVEVPRAGHAPLLDERAALAEIVPFLQEHAGKHG